MSDREYRYLDEEPKDIWSKIKRVTAKYVMAIKMIKVPERRDSSQKEWEQVYDKYLKRKALRDDCE